MQFTASTVTVDESAGTATLTIQRTGPTDTAVSIGVGTRRARRRPGVDYTPVFQQVRSPPARPRRPSAIPIIDNTVIDGDRTFGVFLGDPVGTVVVGDVAATGIVILNNDFDTVPPAVLATSLVPGIGGGVVGVDLRHERGGRPGLGLAAEQLQRRRARRRRRLRHAGRPGDPDRRWSGSTTTPDSIVVAFGVPVPDGQFVAVAMSGGPGGVTDLSGNLVDGDGDGTAGGFLIETLARGNRISYTDADGDLVSLALAGIGGTLEVVRGSTGDASVVRVAEPGRRPDDPPGLGPPVPRPGLHDDRLSSRASRPSAGSSRPCGPRRSTSARSCRTARARLPVLTSVAALRQRRG